MKFKRANLTSKKKNFPFEDLGAVVLGLFLPCPWLLATLLYIRMCGLMCHLLTTLCMHALPIAAVAAPWHGEPRGAHDTCTTSPLSVSAMTTMSHIATTCSLFITRTQPCLTYKTAELHYPHAMGSHLALMTTLQSPALRHQQGNSRKGCNRHPDRHNGQMCTAVGHRWRACAKGAWDAHSLPLFQRSSGVADLRVCFLQRIKCPLHGWRFDFVME